MSITNPFNFGPRIGSVGMNFTGKSPEVMASGKKKWLVPPSPLAPGIPDDNPNPPFSPGGSGGPGLVGGSDFWNPPNPLDDQLGGGGGGGQSYGGVRTRFSNVLNPMWYPSEPPHPLKCTTWDGSSGEIYKLSEGGIITTYVDAGKTQHCCTKRQVSDIVNAFTSLTSELDTVNCLSLFPGLYDCILDTWSNSKLKIICVPNSNSRSRTSPPIIALSNNYWSSHTYAANRFETIKALLLHELVHLCGGTELDAEAIEQYCIRYGTRVDHDDMLHITDQHSDPYEFRTRKIVDPVTGKTVYRGKWVEWDASDNYVYIVDPKTGVRVSRKLFKDPWPL